jgi:hypothetical protein
MIRGTKIFWLGVVAVSTLPLAGCNRRGEFSPVDMWNRSRIKPLESAGGSVITEHASARQIPPGTVYRGQTERDKLYPASENGMTVRQMQEIGRVRDTPDSVNMVGVVGGAPGTATGPNAGGRAGRGGTTTGVGAAGDYRVRGGGATMTRFPFPVNKQVLERGKERYEIYCSPCHGLRGDGDGMVVRRGFAKPPTYHQARLREAPVGHYFDVITNGFGAMYPYASRIEPEDRWAIVAYIRALQLARNAKISDVPVAERANIGKPKPKSTPAHGEHGGEH